MTEDLPPIDPAVTALLVMDFQTNIIGLLEDPAPLVQRAAQAIELVRGRGGRIGYVRVAWTDADYENFPPTSMMGNRIAASGRAMHADEPSTAIDPAVAPQDGDIIVRKVRVGAFSTTDLDDQLRAAGVTTIVLAGISTSGVVLSTVRDAHDRDYRVVVLSDVCGDPDPEVHRVLMDKVFPRQAHVITLAELDPLLG